MTRRWPVVAQKGSAYRAFSGCSYASGQPIIARRANPPLSKHGHENQIRTLESFAHRLRGGKFFDEMWDAGGQARPHYRHYLDRLQARLNDIGAALFKAYIFQSFQNLEEEIMVQQQEQQQQSK